MSEEVNKQVVREYVEAFNRGDMEALRGLFTPDASWHQHPPFNRIVGRTGAALILKAADRS